VKRQEELAPSQRFISAHPDTQTSASMAARSISKIDRQQMLIRGAAGQAVFYLMVRLFSYRRIQCVRLSIQSLISGLAASRHPCSVEEERALRITSKHPLGIIR
jgi:hypothetical protein